MKSAKYIYLLIITFLMACGPKPQTDTSTTKDDTQPTGGSENQKNQVIIASSSEEEKGQPLVTSILNRVVGGAEGSYIGHKMDQLANQLEQKFPKAEVSRIGEGILMKLGDDNDFKFTGSTNNLSDQQKNQLKSLSQILSVYEQTEILLSYHADEASTINQNQKLARERVEQVAIQLKQYQIDSNRLVLRWQGYSSVKDNANSYQHLEIALIANKQMLRTAKMNVSDR